MRRLASYVGSPGLTILMKPPCKGNIARRAYLPPDWVTMRFERSTYSQTSHFTLRQLQASSSPIYNPKVRTESRSQIARNITSSASPSFGSMRLARRLIMLEILLDAVRFETLVQALRPGVE